MKRMLLKQILVAGLSLTLMGCLATNQVKPPKPTLEIQLRDDGGMCLDRDSTYKLGDYIQQLENK